MHRRDERGVIGKPNKTIEEYIQIIEKSMSIKVDERVKVSFWRVGRMVEIEGKFVARDREACSIFLEDNTSVHEIPINKIHEIERCI